jgi:hypothetical protein
MPILRAPTEAAKRNRHPSPVDDSSSDDSITIGGMGIFDGTNNMHCSKRAKNSFGGDGAYDDRPERLNAPKDELQRKNSNDEWGYYMTGANTGTYGVLDSPHQSPRGNASPHKSGRHFGGEWVEGPRSRSHSPQIRYSMPGVVINGKSAIAFKGEIY